VKPFTDAQIAEVQHRLNENYSRNDGLAVDEDHMRDITCSVLGIEDFESKANFLFYDCRRHDIGIEFKKRLFPNPIDQIGRYVDFTTSRKFDGVPRDDAQESIRYIVEKYNAAVDDFSNQCGGNIWLAGALHNKDTLVYYHAGIDRLNPDDLIGEWDWSRGTKDSKPTYNLYVRDRKDGHRVFTYLTKGEKLQKAFKVPEIDEVHIFKARRTHVFEKVSIRAYQDFMAVVATPNEDFETVLSRMTEQLA